MATPANPDTLNNVGATDDVSRGGLFNSGSNTVLTTLDAAIAANVGLAQTAATDAATSATSAAASATTATTQAASATTSATSATNSATSATNSATSATNSAATATTQAALATTNGAAQVTLATAQVALATTQANNAATSATTATTQATNASNYASSALASKNSAEAAFDSFDDRYLGAKASDPSVDNDGNALLTGALYFDSTNNTMKVYTGSAWTAAYVSGSGFAALSGATFTGNISAPSYAGNITSASGNLIADPATQILEVKGDGSSVEGQIQLNCHANSHGQIIKAQPHNTNTTNTMLLPQGANSTLVSLVSTDTLTNKTLTSPTINGGTLNSVTANTQSAGTNNTTIATTAFVQAATSATDPTDVAVAMAIALG